MQAPMPDAGSCKPAGGTSDDRDLGRGACSVLRWLARSPTQHRQARMARRGGCSSSGGLQCRKHWSFESRPLLSTWRRLRIWSGGRTACPDADQRSSVPGVPAPFATRVANMIAELILLPARTSASCFILAWSLQCLHEITSYLFSTVKTLCLGHDPGSGLAFFETDPAPRQIRSSRETGHGTSLAAR